MLPLAMRPSVISPDFQRKLADSRLITLGAIHAPYSYVWTTLFAMRLVAVNLTAFDAED